MLFLVRNVATSTKEKYLDNNNKYKPLFFNKIIMTPEIYLDVFIIDNYYEETENKSQKTQKHPEIIQRELFEFC